jgi:hypothetical protein
MSPVRAASFPRRTHTLVGTTNARGSSRNHGLRAGWLDRRVRRSPLQGFRNSHRLFLFPSPGRGPPSQGSAASRSAPIVVAASSVAAPSAPFPRPRGVPSIDLPPGPKTARRLPQASPPSQGSGRDVLTGPARTGSTLLGFVPLQRRGPQRSASRGFASPATVRPRSSSLPRRFALSSISRARWARCRSWGFDSKVLSSARAVTCLHVRCVVPTPARAVLAHLRAHGRSLPSSGRRLSLRVLVPRPWSRDARVPLRSPSSPSRGTDCRPRRPLPRFSPRRLGEP